MTTTPPLRHPRTGTPTGYTATYATTVVGTADQLTNVIANHRTAGTLIALGRPFPLPYRAGHYQIRMRLRTTTAQRPAALRRPAITAATHHPSRARTRPARRTAIGTVLATAALGGLTTIAYLLGALTELTIPHRREFLVVGVLAALATAAVRVRRRRHCPGC
jgi:hypothetical protein